MEKGGTKILIFVLVILILVAGGVLGYKIVKDKKENTQTEEQTSEADTVLVTPVQKKEIQIYKGNDRPIAVMYDNHNQAWPQAGLNNAYLVYEIIVEVQDIIL